MAHTAPPQDRQSRGNVAILAILVLSFGLFVSMLSFVLLHPVAAGQPILIQTATPGNASDQEQLASPTTLTTLTVTPTASAKPGGSGGPAATPTATPRPTPASTATPPPPTDTPTPLPTRKPQ
ncbi:MAG TPA: hypothetical protein VKB76_09940 [Ktedonobacterales bacterium]|nr:hypothetical protein [Ktedonobacterales bacterium]